jgi:hypothetical protein
MFRMRVWTRDTMTGPYSRCIEHLARTYEQDSPVYAGAFELAISTFPAYLPAEIAKDVMRQRRLNAERVPETTEFRSPSIIDPALFVDLARHDREKDRQNHAK